MKYQNKSFSVGMPRVTQEQWDAIFKKKREERQQLDEFARGLQPQTGTYAVSDEDVSKS